MAEQKDSVSTTELHEIRLLRNDDPLITSSIPRRKDFEHYAVTCFQAFGDRVKHWITFNEPHGYSIKSYDLGIQAPGRCSFLGHILCKKGNSSSEPYIVAHNILLSHAAAYHSYENHFKVLMHTFFFKLGKLSSFTA